MVEMMGEMINISSGDDDAEDQDGGMVTGTNIGKVKKEMKVYSVMIGMMFFTLCWFAFAEV